MILLFLLPLVSGQCSTCLGGRCYDTGQCILGCVPGYVNEYCDTVCPSNCLKNVCHVDRTSWTISCTDGCIPGYCGTKCTHVCPGDCATCGRQCGSCNVTLCPEGRYGEGCSSVCDLAHEKCDRETGRCIRCRRGYYGDNCDRKCRTCFSRGRNLIYKCISGCKACKDEDPCPGGLFGEECERKCPDNCGQSHSTGGHPCNRATGECSAGCVSGYHGLTCNYTCSEHCLSGRCNRATGECSDGCVSGFHGLTCNYTCNRFCEGRICNQLNGICTYGCMIGYQQKLDLCDKLQDDGFKMTGPVSVGVLFVCISIVLIAVAVFLYCLNRKRRVIPRCCAKSDRHEPVTKPELTEVIKTLLKHKAGTKDDEEWITAEKNREAHKNNDVRSKSLTV